MSAVQPIFSVIIPTLQEERVLRRTLEQFTPEIKQRHNIEVIVSDGGSSDATLAIANSLADKVVTAEPGIRQTIALGRNAGAMHAEGDILLYIDADVLFEKIDDFFTEILNAFKNQEIVALTCTVRVYENEELFRDIVFHGFFNRYFSFLNTIGIGMGRGECQMIRKSAFESVGKYNATMAAGEDFDLYSRLKSIGKVQFMHALVVRESPRRFRKLGYVKVTMLWFFNALSVMLFKKSAVDEWKPVR